VRLLASLLVLFIVLAAAPGAALPEGQMTWGVHISLAPTWFDPAETPGIATPFMILYALHDALVKPMPGNAMELKNLIYPHEFSGGQRQRIAIARALVTYPKLIILDEPVSALDGSIRAQILNLLKHLQEKLGLAYVMISHDLAAARYLSTRLAVMYAGKLVETGECDAVYTEPLHPYTQALLSAALPLHPSARRQRIVLAGEVPSPMNPPAGCRFHPRCARAMPQCRTEEPEGKEVRPGRFTACHLY
jgi:oligopeptide/dipeptide ABC transporter ATP-binding protein